MFTLRTYTTKALPKLQYREWPTPQPRRKPENCYTLGLATTPFQTGTQKVVLRDHELAASWSRPKEGGSQLVGASGGHTLGWAMASNCPPCGPAPMGEGSGGNGYSHPKGRSPGQSVRSGGRVPLRKGASRFTLREAVRGRRSWFPTGSRQLRPDGGCQQPATSAFMGAQPQTAR